jgi:hypothetical protein
MKWMNRRAIANPQNAQKSTGPRTLRTSLSLTLDERLQHSF